MSVILTRKFWNGSQYDDISKIVFTSTNIDSPAAAGTRSHVLPGSPYVGTWFEAVDLQYKQKINQDPPDKQECLFNQMHLYQNSFTFGTDTFAVFISKFNITTSGTVYYDNNSNANINTLTYVEDVTVSGILFKKYNVDFSSTNGSATVSGSHYYFNEPYPTISGSNTLPGAMYIWQDNIVNNDLWAHPQNSIIFEVEQGEAYNCRLTAWDDITHTTTNNRILKDKHYRVTCCAYMAGSGTKEAPYPDQSSDAMAFPPGVDVVLSGDDSYYGYFDLIHVADGGSTGNQIGEFFYFTPRLDNIDASFSSGNYDFVTTFHYQYT
jgi:hypothetical protein